VSRPRDFPAALALLVAWCLLLFYRDVWTPDEPRELALAASQIEEFTALPALGGEPFAEKPPLTYWLSGAAMRELGVSAAAARAPQLLYALLAVYCVYLLGKRLASRDIAWAAALMFATSAQVLGVQIWLSTDALLLAATALALLGIYGTLDPHASRGARAASFAIMHIGLLLALFTKNFAGWLVPVTTLLAYLGIERRLRCLAAPGFWLPLLGTVALMAFWAHAVAAMPGGAASIYQLFTENLVGRLASFRADDAARVLGHRNWPGKYLVEMPLYLLPWTPLGVAAVLRTWRERRLGTPQNQARRFALCAIVPGFIALSFAATARGTYAAPLLIGTALLMALAIVPARARETDEFDGLARRSLRWTAGIVLVVDGCMLAAIGALRFVRGGALDWGVWAVLFAIGSLVALCFTTLRSAAAPRAPFSAAAPLLGRLAFAHSVVLIAIALTIFPLLDGGQDLRRIATTVEQAAHGRPLILWRPDETTLAMSDLYLHHPACIIARNSESDAQATIELARCQSNNPRAVVVALQYCSTRECQALPSLLSTQDPLRLRALALTDAVLIDAGFTAAAAIARPGGRTYVFGVRDP